ncbi:Uncharacterised protein [uncultured Clostridium sp.]|nr:Uncharacterised protein [uncultured Clostridium sp.]
MFPGLKHARDCTDYASELETCQGLHRLCIRIWILLGVAQTMYPGLKHARDLQTMCPGLDHARGYTDYASGLETC